MSSFETVENDEESLQLKTNQENPQRPNKQESRGSKGCSTIEIIAALGTLVAVFIIGMAFKKDEKAPVPEPKWRPRTLKSGVTYYCVPHSHDDLGWVYTIKEYFDRNVSKILSSSTKALQEDPRSIFTYTEVGFLKLWADAAPGRYQILRELVSKGQLEMLNGGISAHDNACPYYDDIISNYEYGREWLNNNVGQMPRSGWLIDPFGLSLTTIRLYAEMGYDFYFINRIPSTTKRRLMKHGNAAFNWVYPDRPEYNLLTTVLFDYYTSPGLLMNQWPNTTTIAASIFDYHMDMMGVYNSILEHFRLFNTDLAFGDLNIALIPFGDDFWYTNFPAVILHLDQVVVFSACNNITGRLQGYNFMKSNVTTFFKAMSDRLKAKGKTVADLRQKKRGDFFPLVDEPRNFYGDVLGRRESNTDPLREVDDPFPSNTDHFTWSGYFTTNPYQKKTNKSFGQLIRSLKTLLALEVSTGRTNYDSDVQKVVDSFDQPHQIVGINIHHDAITGTSKNRIVEDYLQKMVSATIDIHSSIVPYVISSSLPDCTSAPSNATLVWPQTENILPSTAQTYLLLAPLSTASSILLRGSVESTVPPSFLDFSDHELSSWAGCAPWGWCDFAVSVPMPHCAPQNKTQRALFRSDFSRVQKQVTGGRWKRGGLEVGKLFVESTSEASKYPSMNIEFQLQSDKIVLQNKKADLILHISLHQYRYDPKFLDKAWRNGKYCFASVFPSDPLPFLRYGSIYQFDPSTGTLYLHVLLVNSTFNLTISYRPEADPEDRLSVRFYGARLPADGENNTNYVVRYSVPDLNSGDLFTTDSNGLEKMERKRFSQWQYVDANYYPLTKFMFVEDKNKRFSVLVDRACGGWSPRSGELEVMINRVTNVDDALGVFEPLNEPYSVNILHRLILEDKNNDQLLYRKAQVIEDAPSVLISLGTSSPKCPTTMDDSAEQISPYLKLQSDIRSRDRIMFRLTNLHDTAPLTVDLVSLLRTHFSLTPSTITSMSLDFVNSAAQLNSQLYMFNKRTYPEWTGQSVLLKPLEIRTFKLEIM